MKKALPFVIALLALAAVVWWVATPHQPAADEGEGGGEVQPVAHVTVAKAERKTLSETVTAYGSVVAQPGKTHAVSVAFEARVRHILVAPGQLVREDEPLVEIEPSPAAQLQFQEAESAAEAARKELDQTQKRYDMKLATNQELGQAQKAARDAELQLESLKAQGVGGDNRVRSGVAGILAQVDAQDGQLVAAGSPFVEIVAEDEIEVKLGVEAEDLRGIEAGQKIALFPVNDPGIGKVEGTIRLVTRRVDPQTRLVDVYVSLPPGTHLLLSGYMRGEIVTEAKDSLVVPRSALLPDDGGFNLFTVKDGHAIKHIVQTGIENDQQIAIFSEDLHPGDAVVTSGNFELTDGMAVEVAQGK